MATPQRSSDERLASIQAAAAVLCKRWKPAIILSLADGRRRYNELARHLGGITAKVLTQQLRELERDGVVVRQPTADAARHVGYALTPIGEALLPALAHLERWGDDYRRVRTVPGWPDGHRDDHESPPGPPRADTTER